MSGANLFWNISVIAEVCVPQIVPFVPLTFRRICQGMQVLKLIGHRSICPPSRSTKYGGGMSPGQPLRVKTPTSQTTGRTGRLSLVYRTTLPVYPRLGNPRMSQHG
jgi:hypothetical protein